MNSVRGPDKTPGEFRLEQNWIGKPGCTIGEATFVSPNPIQLPDHLRAWEAYLDSDDLDYLIQTAVVHAQFELLHPFKDGNGHIGHILNPLFLYQKKIHHFDDGCATQRLGRVRVKAASSRWFRAPVFW